MSDANQLDEARQIAGDSVREARARLQALVLEVAREQGTLLRFSGAITDLEEAIHRAQQEFMSAPSSIGPPYNSSNLCPMCPLEVRNLHAVAHNVLKRWDAIMGGEPVAHFRSKLEDLRDAVEVAQPLVDAHFANRAHSHAPETAPVVEGRDG